MSVRPTSRGKAPYPQTGGEVGMRGDDSLPDERLRDVLRRIAGGYYDRPEVKRLVVHRIAKDL